MISHRKMSLFKSKFYCFLMQNIKSDTKIFQEGGLRALYRGFLPTIFGMIPYAGFSFYTFEKLKYLCMRYSPNYLCSKCEKNTGK